MMYHRKIGELYLFVSYAPGTGKSYRMCQMASQQELSGRSVIYASIFDGHRDIPKPTACHSYSIPTLLEAAPDIVVMDEFTLKGENADDPNRFIYEDVDILLEHDISVYTTVNMTAFEEIDKRCSAQTGFHRKQLLSDRWLIQATRIYFIDMDTGMLYQNYLQNFLFPKSSKNPTTDLIFRRENLELYRKESMIYLQQFSNVIWWNRNDTL
ncbi:MAG: hypothetical protein J6B10_07415 [Lachnospiraceae bacterium]|nr:hypothetical protein [Lachnospiraceae bacterium]